MKKYYPYILAIIVQLQFGGLHVVSEEPISINKTLTSYDFVAYRTLLATILLYITTKIKYGARYKVKFALRTIHLMIFSVVLNQSLVFIGLSQSDSRLSTVMQSMIPVFTFFFSICANKSRPNIQLVVGVFVVFTCALFFDYKRLTSLNEDIIPVVVFMAQTASVSLFFVLQKKFMTEKEGEVEALPLPLSTSTFMSAVPILIAAQYAFGHGFRVEHFRDSSAIVAILYASILSTLISYSLMAYINSKCHPVFLGSTVILQPIFALAFGKIIRDINVPAYKIYLAIGTCVGVVIVAYGNHLQRNKNERSAIKPTEMTVVSSIVEPEKVS
ncbi:hypothetical protein PCE1_000879 [Barthelona sp. PCE]